METGAAHLQLHAEIYTLAVAGVVLLALLVLMVGAIVVSWLRAGRRVVELVASTEALALDAEERDRQMRNAMRNLAAALGLGRAVENELGPVVAAVLLGQDDRGQDGAASDGGDAKPDAATLA